VEFLALSADERTILVDQIADDVAGMIERLRQLPNETVDNPTFGRNSRKPRVKFDARAHNFNDVDPVSDARIFVESPAAHAPRAVFAQIEFLPRMYVQSENARVEFGIRRALLSLIDGGGKRLSRIDDGTGPDAHGNVYYLNVRDTPDAITVCIDPVEDRFTLEELPLPPARGENKLSKIATAAPDVDLGKLDATLSISLCPEGLFVFGADDIGGISPSTKKKIAAIIGVAVSKDLSAQSGRLERPVPILERKR
jgi:hypothetical protein